MLSTAISPRFFQRLFAVLTAASVCFLAVGPVGAQDAEDTEEPTTPEEVQTPAQEEETCRDVVKACDTNAIFSAYGTMRTECKAYRDCMGAASAAKSSCNASAKAAKRECKDECKSLSGKAKKECKKKCNDEKKTAKRQCKDAKKAAKNECKQVKESSGCVAARTGFWGALTGSVKNCAADVASTCESPFPKK